MHTDYKRSYSLLRPQLIGPIVIFRILFEFRDFRFDEGFFVVVGQLHEDVPKEEHPGNLTILMS